MPPRQTVSVLRPFDRGQVMAVERAEFSASWMEAAVAAFLCDGEAAADQMERDADALDGSPESQGIANLLRDRASDLRRKSEPHHRQW